MSFISDKVYELIQARETVTSALAASPTATVESITDGLYKNFKSDHSSKAKVGERKLTPADMDRVAQCGKFTSRPSDLFLQVCHASSGYIGQILIVELDIC
jgi:hypothetical protein